MISFKSYLFLLENKAEKTLNWIKNQKHNEMTAAGLEKHDRSMFREIGNNNSYRHGEVPLHHLAIDKLAHMDPSPDKAHTQQLHHWWASGDFKHEDHPRVTQALDKFVRHKKDLGNTTVERSGKKGSDIGAYETFHDLESHLEKHFGEKKSTKGDFSHPETIEHHNKDGLKVHELLTKEASMHTRKCFDNKWCTSRNDEHNMHDEYAKDGKLYHVHMPDNTHWQFHFETGSFADHNDKMHDIEDILHKYPQLKDVKEFKRQPIKHALHFAKDEAEKDKMIKRHLQNEIVTKDEIRHLVKHGTPNTVDHVIDSGHHIQTKNDFERLMPVASEKQLHRLLDVSKDAYDNYDRREISRSIAKTDNYSIAKRLLSHEDHMVRAELAKSRWDDVRQKLAHDPNSYVRQKLAEHGHHRDRDILIHDKDPLVRSAAVTHGIEGHANALLHDPDTSVQGAIAWHSTNRSHLEHLAVHANTERIREHAKSRLAKKGDSW